MNIYNRLINYQSGRNDSEHAAEYKVLYLFCFGNCQNILITTIRINFISKISQGFSKYMLMVHLHFIIVLFKKNKH